MIIFECGYANAEKTYGYTKKEFFSYFSELGYLVFDIHGMLATPDKWDNRKLGYEFLAIHEDDSRLMHTLIETERFWESAQTWPLMQSWSECAQFGHQPPNLLML